RGHRAHSFVPADVNELVEVRARQRTFDGAYARTALLNLGYSLTVLRLFNRRFYRIGMLYAALATLLFLASFLRARHSRHDFSDSHEHEDSVELMKEAVPTRGNEGKQVLGRPFVTAGWIVIMVAAIVAATELALLALIIRMW
ncbi:hypothetical protein BV25DRAFT_1813375, partial [Artomyces pyxidatus]